MLHVKQLIVKKMNDLTTGDWQNYCKRADDFHSRMWEREEEDRELLQGRWHDDDMEVIIDDSDDYAE